jgi:hypothetical protein
MVGTASKTVTRWPAMIGRACQASNRGSRVRHAPDATATFIATVWPNTWNSGSPPNMTSSGARADDVGARHLGVADEVAVGELGRPSGGRSCRRCRGTSRPCIVLATRNRIDCSCPAHDEAEPGAVPLGAVRCLIWMATMRTVTAVIPIATRNAACCAVTRRPPASPRSPGPTPDVTATETVGRPVPSRRR